MNLGFVGNQIALLLELFLAQLASKRPALAVLQVVLDPGKLPVFIGTITAEKPLVKTQNVVVSKEFFLIANVSSKLLRGSE